MNMLSRLREWLQARLPDKRSAQRATNQAMLDAVPVGMYHLDSQGHVLYANPEMRRILRREDPTGMDLADVLASIHPDDQDKVLAEFQHMQLEARSGQIAYRYLCGDGPPIWVLGRATAQHNAQGQLMGFIGSVTDLTHERELQARADRQSQFYATLRQVNAAILHAQDEETLYQQICHLIVETGGIATAGISCIDWQTRQVTLVSRAGAWQTELAHLVRTGDRLDDLDNQTLTHLTLRSSGAIMVDQLASDERLSLHQRELMLRLGILSASSVPFFCQGQIAGVLVLSAHEADFFNPEVLALLDEVGQEVSFALDVFARERQRLQTQARLAQEEHNLRASERLYNTLVNTIPVGIYRSDVLGNPIFTNQMLLHLNGFKGERLMAEASSQTVHPADRQRLTDTFQQALQNRTPWTMSDLYRYLHPDGTVVWARTYASPLFDEHGQFEGFVGAAVDATAEHLYQQKVERVSHFYATLTQVNAAIIRSNSEAALYQAICTLLQATGGFPHVLVFCPDWDQRELVLAFDPSQCAEQAQPLLDVHRLPMDGPQSHNLTNLALQTGQIQHTHNAQNDTRISHLLHEVHHVINVVSACIVPFTRFGEVAAVLTVGSPEENYFTDDIRELIAEIGRNVSFALENFAREAQRQTAETQRAKQEEHLRVTLHSIGDAVLVTDAGGQVTMMNPVAERLTGWPEAQAQGKPVAEVFHIINQDTRAVIENPVATILREGTVVGLANHTVLIAHDGTERPIADSGAPIRYTADGHIQGVVLVFRDQTEEYRILQALKDSERLYSSLVKTSPVGILQFDRNGEVDYVNDAMRHMAGLYGEDISVAQWIRHIHPEDQARIKSHWQEWIGNGNPHKWEAHYRYLHPNGDLTWVKALVVSIKDDEGLIDGYVGVITDVTAETELRTQTEKLARMYATLSRVNSIITQVKDVDSLYRDVCSAIVEVGQFEDTVVMSIDWDKRQLKQVSTGSVSNTHVPSHVQHRDLDDPHAQSVANLAVFSNQRVVSNAVHSDERLSPSIREAAQSIYIEACVALPLRQMGQIVGTLGILSRERHFFTEDMLALLDEIARDVSHALDNIAREALRQQAEDALARNEERLRLGLQITHTGMYEVDYRHDCITLDATCMRLMGLGNAAQTFDNPTFLQLLPDAERGHVITGHQALLNGTADHYTSDAHWTLPDGSSRWLRNYGGLTAERGASGKPIRLLGVIYDISATKALEQRDHLAATVFDQSNEAIMIANPDAIIMMVNQAFTQITGYTPEEVVGQPVRVIYSDRHDLSFYKDIRDTLQRDGLWSGEIWRRRKNGRVFPAAVSVAQVRDFNGVTTHYVSQETDITTQKEYEARISHLAYRDALTDLPNRALLRDRMDQSIAFAHREGLSLALLFLDLDHFKNINDSLGHGVGDQLLQEVAQRLTGAVRDMDTVGRLGGDEFLILLPDTGAEQAAAVAQKLLKECAQPVTVNAHTLMVTPSVGIALYPKDGSDFDSLLKSADTAMYRAKDEGRNAYRFFTPEMNQAVFGRMVLEANLRQAIERREFVLHFQPQYDLNTQTLIGAEALLRWHQPDIGLVSPAQFIPVAEASGLIVGIGQWVLEEACRQIKAWRDEGLPPLRIAVNFSARQFAAKNIAELVTTAIQNAGIPGESLEMEITESLLANDMDYTLGVLQTLKDHGIQVAIDDFGTGYSSLSYLKRFPIDLLKIDQSFVRDLETDADDRAIASAIVTMGHSLGIQVIAEGVETGKQMAILREMGCDAAQGYHLGRPMPAEQLSALLRAQVPRANAA